MKILKFGRYGLTNWSGFALLALGLFIPDQHLIPPVL